MRPHHARLALFWMALCSCGDSGSTGMDPVTQPPAAGGSVPTAGTASAGTTAASAGTPAAGSGGRTATAGTTATGAAGTGAGGRSGSGGSPSSAAGTGAGAPAAGSGGGEVPAAGSGGSSGAPAAGSGGTGGASSPTLSENDTLVPHASWDCGMPLGIPSTKGAELAFEAKLTLGEVYDLGETQFGKRLLIEVKGGTVEGPEIKGTLLDRGLDWQLTLPNGAQEIEQVNIIRTSEGTNIYFRNCGTAATEDGEVRIVPDIEAPSAGRYNWLNTTKLIGTRKFDRAAKTMTMSVYKMPAAAAGGAMVKVENPAGLPDQSWECAKPEGRRGGVMYTESVGIGAGSVSVGASKRGSRNIIPITGGTTMGKIEGGVLSGGADFQLSAGGQFILDARYTLKTKEGELIIVRNCGPIGALVPVFETKKDGPYSFVNTAKYLSSDPGIAPGAVNLTIYDTN